MNLHPSSFRDSAGNLFYHQEQLYRGINISYKDHYDQLMTSGLYDILIKKNWIVKHAEVSLDYQHNYYKIIRPQPIPFISYPYEWCFDQLKDAAMRTLDITLIALQHDMILKDASGYNIQFEGYEALLIDTLSFEKYKEGTPWIAYRQFCENFLLPLAITSYTDLRLQSLLAIYIDGVPMDYAMSLLPWRARLSLGINLHIYLHANSITKHNKNIKSDIQVIYITKSKLVQLISHLRDTIKSLHIKNKSSQWKDYYVKDTLAEYDEAKQLEVQQMLEQCGTINKIWDMGANNGMYSRIASRYCNHVLSSDIDRYCVAQNYVLNKQHEIKNVLPLYGDLLNPSPAIGWAGQERMSWWDRVEVDVIIALAIIHHLVITHYISFEMIAKLIATKCKYLIIEFANIDDEKVKFLLQNNTNYNYHINDFLFTFEKYFIIKKHIKLNDTRALFLMQTKKQ